MLPASVGIHISRPQYRMNTHDNELLKFDQRPQNHCFVCGQANLGGLKIEFFLDEGRSVYAFPTIPPVYDGYPGHVHGGIIATMLDEVMSKSVRAKGFTAVTRHIEVDYLRPVPSSAPLRLEGRVTHNEGRKHWTEGKVLDKDGKLLARGKALFLQVTRPETEGSSL